MGQVNICFLKIVGDSSFEFVVVIFSCDTGSNSILIIVVIIILLAYRPYPIYNPVIKVGIGADKRVKRSDTRACSDKCKSSIFYLVLRKESVA